MPNDLISTTPLAGRVHLGVDVGGTKMLVIAYTADGFGSWTFPTGPRCGPETINSHLQAVLSRLGRTSQMIVGLAVPGLIGDDSTIIECDVLPGLAGWNPKRQMPDVSPACVLNDGDAALVVASEGEPPEATVAAVGSGTALIAAFQVGGVRLRRLRPYAGELGYVPYGLTGTLDENSSGSSLLRRLGLSADELVERLAQGEPRAAAAVYAAGEAFGAGLAMIVNLVHPEKIGLYGGTLRYAGYLTAAFAALDRLAHPLLRPLCRVEVMPEPQTVVATGALLEALRT